jgi:dTDP-4-dehydrorhamnose 3,5-epimerase
MPESHYRPGPATLAHGFAVPFESAEFLYKTTDYWYPEYERSLRWNDPQVGIASLIQDTPQLAKK